MECPRLYRVDILESRLGRVAGLTGETVGRLSGFCGFLIDCGDNGEARLGKSFDYCG